MCLTSVLTWGREVTGDLAAAERREWLCVTYCGTPPHRRRAGPCLRKRRPAATNVGSAAGATITEPTHTRRSSREDVNAAHCLGRGRRAHDALCVAGRTRAEAEVRGREVLRHRQGRQERLS